MEIKKNLRERGAKLKLRVWSEKTRRDGGQNTVAPLSPLPLPLPAHRARKIAARQFLKQPKWSWPRINTGLFFKAAAVPEVGVYGEQMLRWRKHKALALGSISAASTAIVVRP